MPNEFFINLDQGERYLYDEIEGSLKRIPSNEAVASKVLLYTSSGIRNDFYRFVERHEKNIYKERLSDYLNLIKGERREVLVFLKPIDGLLVLSVDHNEKVELFDTRIESHQENKNVWSILESCRKDLCKEKHKGWHPTRKMNEPVFVAWPASKFLFRTRGYKILDVTSGLWSKKIYHVWDLPPRSSKQSSPYVGNTCLNFEKLQTLLSGREHEFKKPFFVNSVFKLNELIGKCLKDSVPVNVLVENGTLLIELNGVFLLEKFGKYELLVRAIDKNVLREKVGHYGCEDQGATERLTKFHEFGINRIKRGMSPQTIVIEAANESEGN